MRATHLSLLVIFLATVVNGCVLPIPSHLHDENRYNAAQKASAAMDGYSKAAPAMYSAMTANVNVYRTQEESLLSQLAAQQSSALISLGPQLTTSNLVDRSDLMMAAANNTATFLDCRARLLQAQIAEQCANSKGPSCPPEPPSSQDLKNQCQELLGFLDCADPATVNSQECKQLANQVQPKTLVALAQNVNAAQKAVDDDKQTITDWNKSTALFQTLIVSFPSDEKAVSSQISAVHGGTPSLSPAQSVLEQKVTYVDADGITGSSTVGDILKSAGTQAFLSEFSSTTSTVGNPSALQQIFGQPPGTQLIVANLGLELAEIEQKRATSELAQFTATLQYLVSAEAELQTASKLFADGHEPFEILQTEYPTLSVYSALDCQLSDNSSKVCVPSGTPPPAPLTKLGKIDGLYSTIVPIREEVVGEVILTRVTTSATLNLARIDHLNSITESQFNDQAYEALIQSGLGGEESYEKGGLTAEDIANIIRFAQAVTVGVIAGQI
jgi:hypothetical protein